MSIQGLFCQMMIGGNATALPLPLAQCVVPQDINGPVAIFITKDGTPLPNDVVERNCSTVVAGPTMGFIDTNSQLLSQLALGGKKYTSGDNSTSTISPAAASSIEQSGATPTESASSAASTTASAEPFVGTPGGQNDFVGQVDSGLIVHGWKPVPKPTST